MDDIAEVRDRRLKNVAGFGDALRRCDNVCPRSGRSAKRFEVHMNSDKLVEYHAPPTRIAHPALGRQTTFVREVGTRTHRSISLSSRSMIVCQVADIA